MAAPLGAAPEPPKEASGEDVLGTPNISGPDTTEFHFRKGVPYQY
jgi:hypothetical protein